MKRIFKSITLSIILLSPFVSEAKQPQRGYRGFVEWSNDFRSERFYGYTDREGLFYTGLTTSHGYQINHVFFVGAGIGMDRCTKFDSWVAPVFVQGRADFAFGRLTPFADLRLGYNLGQGGGAYFSPTVGYRINWGRKVGLNIGMGLALAGFERRKYDINIIPGELYDITYVGSEHPVNPYFSFRIGLDF